MALPGLDDGSDTPHGGGPGRHHTQKHNIRLVITMEENEDSRHYEDTITVNKYVCCK